MPTSRILSRPKFATRPIRHWTNARVPPAEKPVEDHEENECVPMLKVSRFPHKLASFLAFCGIWYLALTWIPASNGWSLWLVVLTLLAKSTKGTYYKCGACHQEVDFRATVCPHCHSRIHLKAVPFFRSKRWFD